MAVSLHCHLWSRPGNSIADPFGSHKSVASAVMAALGLVFCLWEKGERKKRRKKKRTVIHFVDDAYKKKKKKKKTTAMTTKRRRWWARHSRKRDRGKRGLLCAHPFKTGRTFDGQIQLQEPRLLPSLAQQTAAYIKYRHAQRTRHTHFRSVYIFIYIYT